MSLVKNDKGIYYKNPIFFGVNWYMRFRDSETPEIIIRTFRDPKIESILKRLKLVFKTEGISGIIDPNSHRKTRSAFPPKWIGLHASASFTMSLEEPIPYTVEVEHKGSGVNIPAAMEDSIWPKELL